MRKGIYKRGVIILALAAMVYFLIYKKQRSSKQDPGAAQFRKQLDSLHLKAGDTVHFR